MLFIGFCRFVLLSSFLVHSTGGSTALWPSQLLKALQTCEQTLPLGMITGQIRDWQITSSSVYPKEWDKDCDERYGRVYQQDRRGWCAKYKSASEWLQVDLGVASKVTGFLTQGRGDGEEWVTSFMVSYSIDAFQWQYVTDMYGNQKVYEGNSDSYSVMHSYVDEPFIARFVKFHTVTWSRHPSMRVEVIGCQVCNGPIALPPYGKLTASSEKTSNAGSSCHAEDGYIVTSKAWCAKYDNGNQWLQFDVGPATLVTGLVTKGRGDGGKKHWVTRFRLSYSNDSNVWYFYKEASHLDIKEFGANSDRDDERIHYLTTPFIARFIRFHPLEWHRHVSMRAGLLGCPFRGECEAGFMRVNEYTPCVENVAFRKESWINNRRQLKRHVRNQWLHGHASRAVDGQADAEHQGLSSCTVLDNFYVDRPVWMVDLGRKAKISGVMIVSWLGKDSDERMSYRDYMYNLDKLAVYADNSGGKEPLDAGGDGSALCGFISRLNDALFKPRLHVQCRRPLRARYVYVEAWGTANRFSRLFSAVLCEVMVYE
jgi:lactadherin